MAIHRNVRPWELLWGRFGRIMLSERRGYAGAAEGAGEYEKVLMKKFIFQVHPDFFQLFKTEQAINSANLKVLSSLSGEGSGSVEAPKTRSLTFYVKPVNDSLPRRVKVATGRVIESIREILETLGLDLPLRPEGTGKSSTFVSSNSAEVLDYLDTLIDRF